MSSQRLGFSNLVEIFQVNHSGSTGSQWQSMIRVNGIGVPFAPIVVVGKDILSVLYNGGRTFSFALQRLTMCRQVFLTLADKCLTPLLDKWTKERLKAVEEPSFPLDVFNFRPFNELLQAERVDETEMFEKTSIQSNFDVSGLHINPDLKVIDEFRTIILTGENSNGVRNKPMEYQSAVSGVQELKRENIDISTIEEVFTAQEEKNVWIFGKIVAVNAGKTDWCYKACIKCPKKFERKPEDEFDCKRCKINFEEPKDRYKVEVVAFDGTACINLLLWDRECKHLCGVEARDLLKRIDDNLDEHPSALDTLLGMKILFKLNIKTGVAVNLESDIDTQPIGGTPEDSITSLKCKTPSKRANSSLKSCIQGKDKKDSGKMSTNRFSKKGQKKPLKR
ncbi:hypothetical protein PIB30_105661, partial [Stylosanthes scabra]|nr:hypothetical protein [Stylosanthes scabra]